MNIISTVFDILNHMDTYIIEIVNNFGAYSYAIFGFFIFVETGFVVVPFLPGDSVLFVIGLIASQGSLSLWLIILVLIISAILGDACNYTIGHFFGTKILKNEKILKFIGKEVEKTKAFFHKYGGITIIYARFVPGIRVIAPFLAGATSMEYPKFAVYNIIGGISWVLLTVIAGYFLGNITFIREHLTIMILIIIFVSLLPIIIAYIRSKRKQVIISD